MSRRREDIAADKPAPLLPVTPAGDVRGVSRSGWLADRQRAWLGTPEHSALLFPLSLSLASGGGGEAMVKFN
jgi:hypothetical protein